jgi:hypothetical protein
MSSSPPSSPELADLIASMNPSHMYSVISSPGSEFDPDALAAFTVRPEADRFSESVLHRPVARKGLEGIQERILKRMDMEEWQKDKEKENERRNLALKQKKRELQSYGDIDLKTTLITPGWNCLQQKSTTDG